MKGNLRYCATESGTYDDVGTVRTQKNQDYKIDAITGKNRVEEIEILGFRVYVRALSLELDPDFLDQVSWWFRIYFPNDSEYVPLGQHPYTVDYDGLLRIHEIEYHTVELSFTINYDEYESYAVEKDAV
jgi:hypothetical protein